VVGRREERFLRHGTPSRRGTRRGAAGQRRPATRPWAGRGTTRARRGHRGARRGHGVGTTRARRGHGAGPPSGGGRPRPVVLRSGQPQSIASYAASYVWEWFSPPPASRATTLTVPASSDDDRALNDWYALASGATCPNARWPNGVTS